MLDISEISFLQPAWYNALNAPCKIIIGYWHVYEVDSIRVRARTWDWRNGSIGIPETDRVTLPVHKMIKMTRQEQDRMHANACKSAGNLRIREENNVGVAI